MGLSRKKGDFSSFFLLLKSTRKNTRKGENDRQSAIFFTCIFYNLLFVFFHQKVKLNITFKRCSEKSFINLKVLHVSIYIYQEWSLLQELLWLNCHALWNSLFWMLIISHYYISEIFWLELTTLSRHQPLFLFSGLMRPNQKTLWITSDQHPKLEIHRVWQFNQSIFWKSDHSWCILCAFSFWKLDGT